ncbi:MAG: hypothetical protein ABL907_04460 [Hyphomicrobium sp.]
MVAPSNSFSAQYSSVHLKMEPGRSGQYTVMPAQAGTHDKYPEAWWRGTAEILKPFFLRLAVDPGLLCHWHNRCATPG